MLQTPKNKPVFIFHCNNCGHKFLANDYVIEKPNRRPVPVALLCPKCDKLIHAKI